MENTHFLNSSGLHKEQHDCPKQVEGRLNQNVLVIMANSNIYIDKPRMIFQVILTLWNFKTPKKSPLRFVELTKMVDNFLVSLFDVSYLGVLFNQLHIPKLWPCAFAHLVRMNISQKLSGKVSFARNRSPLKISRKIGGEIYCNCGLVMESIDSHFVCCLSLTFQVMPFFRRTSWRFKILSGWQIFWHYQLDKNAF